MDITIHTCKARVANGDVGRRDVVVDPLEGRQLDSDGVPDVEVNGRQLLPILVRDLLHSLVTRTLLSVCSFTHQTLKRHRCWAALYETIRLNRWCNGDVSREPYLVFLTTLYVIGISPRSSIYRKLDACEMSVESVCHLICIGIVTLLGSSWFRCVIDLNLIS